MNKGLIITVNYNSHKETINYIKSLSKLDKFNYLDIIIADNSSNMTHYNEIFHFVKNNAFNNIDLYKMERNLSYFGAARFIIDNKIAKEFRYEFIIVSNNDILVEDNNFVDKIFSNIRKADILAPKIISLENQTNQNPFQKSKINLKNKLFHIFYYSSFFVAQIIILVRKLFFNKYIGMNSDDKEMPIYAAHGSFLIFSNSFFDKGGYIDNKFFLYAEENTLAEIVLKINGMILYVPDIVVYHESKGTIDKRLTKEKYLIQKKAHEYFNKNYGEA